MLIIVAGFDWEEEHEKFAEVLEHDHPKHGHGMRDSGYGTTDKSYRSQEVNISIA